MRDKYYPPAHNTKQFHCIHCGVFASQSWHKVYVEQSHGSALENTSFSGSMCSHCGARTYWYVDRMIVPAEVPVEPPHSDLPDDCRIDYEEAQSVFSLSPRAAAALLRLCVQKLLPHLGESGTNINDDIKSLVSKGLPSLVQKALDYSRVVGNNAVHPGEIDLNDTPEIAQSLFQMINFIVEDRITRPKEIESLYGKLPEGVRAAIDKRDKPIAKTQN